MMQHTEVSPQATVNWNIRTWLKLANCTDYHYLCPARGPSEITPRTQRDDLGWLVVRIIQMRKSNLELLLEIFVSHQTSTAWRRLGGSLSWTKHTMLCYNSLKVFESEHMVLYYTKAQRSSIRKSHWHGTTTICCQDNE